MIQHPNKYRKLNPAILTAMSKARANAQSKSGSIIPGAAHFWPMTEGSGSTFVDQAGGTNLVVTSPSWAATPVGMGASSSVAGFNGTSTFAQASAVVASLNFSGLTPFSVAVWAYPLSPNAFSICGNLTAPTTYEGWEFTSASGTGTGLLLVNNITTNQMTALNGLQLGQNAPILVVCTYNGSLAISGVTEYINGASTAVTDTTGTLSSSFTSAIPFIVGARSGGSNFYGGYMAYMRTWNQVLTPSQVAALYAAGPR